ncbi:glycosyltransferase [Microbacterium paludicola]|uniref:Glycosyltransferase n=1 Tax=Microbacterium paludicola TaxID=300019 RepID=A0A4Y9FQ56_9MICO|nr:glycosyltransferase [Microbacterium paludicola]MBF0817591.1 glycosyltransferase [Microbacterium paludicola]TFU30643.1 glycosyltransferase [Microbacterium paludicola]
MTADEDDGARPAGSGFGSGALSVFAAFVYWHLIVGFLMTVASLPVVIVLFFLGREIANIPLVPLTLILYGPVLSAGLYALRDRRRAEELAPARSFLRGIRLGWLDALRAWAPPMILLAVIAGAVAAGAGTLPGWYTGILLVLALLVLLWGLNALVIATFFSFRLRDIARLAAFYLGRRWIVTLGELALLIVAGAVVLVGSEGVLWLLAVVFAAFLREITAPLVADVEARFTA